MKKPKKQLDNIFEKAPNAGDFFTEQHKNLFDKLPNSSRQFMKCYLQTANMKEAAHASGLSTYGIRPDENKPLKELLDENGFSTLDIIKSLKTLITTPQVKMDRHGNQFELVDGRLILEAVKLVIQWRGDLSVKRQPVQASSHEIEDLFKNVSLDDETDESKELDNNG